MNTKTLTLLDLIKLLDEVIAEVQGYEAARKWEISQYMDFKDIIKFQ